ncbi:hypothetical protein J7L48_06775, partial [bacterium]|nr:hypothetical protein [bacterium]
MKAKKVFSQVRWFKLTLLIIVTLGIIFAYGKVSNLVHKGISSGLEAAFNAPVEVSSVVWSPFSISIKKIAVVNKNAPEYLFTLNNFKGTISFNHLIRRSFVMKKLNISITTGEKIPADKYEEYKKIISEKEKKDRNESEKKKAEFKQKKQDIKEQIERAFDNYLAEKEPEILAFTKQIDDISSEITKLKSDSTGTIDKIETLKTKLKGLEKNVEDAYQKKDLTTTLALLKRINETKKEIDTVKNDVTAITKTAKTTKENILNTKDGIVAYAGNIKKNYKIIIMNDIGFFMNEIPSLSKIFIAKNLVDKFNKYYAIYKKFQDFRQEHIKNAPKKATQKKIEKAKGKDFSFPLNEVNPKFWLKKGNIEIMTKKMKFNGILENIVLSNKETGKLSKILLKGNNGNEELNIDTYWDNEKFYGEIDGKQFPLKEIDLNVLTINNAKADYSFNYAFSPQKNFTLKANINDVVFDNNSNLYNMAKKITSFNLNASAGNKNNKWAVHASSDLDKQIGNLLKKAFEKKKEEGMAYLDKRFNDWYNKNISQTLGILGKDTNIINSIIDVSKRQKALDNAYSNLKKKVNDHI